MATEGPLLRDGGQTTAAVDLSPTSGLSGLNTSGQYLAVKLTAARSVNLANAGGEQIYGILQNQPTSGQAADVALNGVTKAVIGAAVSAGAKLMTDTSGRLITCTAGNFAVAVALEAGTALGQAITVALIPGGELALLDALYTAVSGNTPATLTGAQTAGANDVTINMTAALAGAGTLNTPTAAQIVAAMPNAVVGQSYKLRIINTSSGNFAWTLTAGTGITLSGTMTIAQNTTRDFVVTLTSLTAVTITSTGTGTYS